MMVMMQRALTWRTSNDPSSFAVVGSVLSWSPANPYAVHLTFGASATLRSDGQQPFGDALNHVEWTFARELFTDVTTGLSHDAGIGDVRVSEISPIGVGPMLQLTLDNGSEKVVLRTSLDAVRRVMNETLAIVPLGREQVPPSFDSELAILLRGYGRGSVT
jgi:hypothetical protein